MSPALLSPTARTSFLRRASLLCLAAVILASQSACIGKMRSTKNRTAPPVITNIGVNSYLWQATLDSLSFMPLVQAEATNGVIITDWYANPSNPGERMKVTVTILDVGLRADSLRVAASRQIRDGNLWLDASVQAATIQKLEEIILTRARALRQGDFKG